jgi:para-nitrobenzyl esterase
MSRKLLRAGALLLLGCAAIASNLYAAANLDIATAEGPLRGIRRNGVREFLGIPYAAPPLGSLRWRPPEPHQPWKTVFAATQMGPSCPQVALDPQDIPTAEDCLFLNISMPPIRPQLAYR